MRNKTLPCILVLSALLSVPALHAQEGGLDIRAGRTFSIDGQRAVPEGPATVSVDYHKGFGAVGVAADIPVHDAGALGLQARAGVRVGGRLATLYPFVSLRCSWLDGPSGAGAGYGASASLRILGPLAVYACLSAAHDLHRCGDRLQVDTKGRATLSLGIQLSI